MRTFDVLSPINEETIPLLLIQRLIYWYFKQLPLHPRWRLITWDTILKLPCRQPVKLYATCGPVWV